MGNPNQSGDRETIVEEILKKWETKPDNPGYHPEMVKKITDKFGTNQEALDVMGDLDKNNCCNKLIDFFTLLQKAGFKKHGPNFFNGNGELIFQSESVIVGSEDKFNNGQHLSLDDIYVNCVGGDGSLSLSEIKNGNDPVCDDYKHTIISFIKKHIEYVNTDCCDKLLNFFTLLQNAGFKKHGPSFFNGNGELIFQSESVIVGSEDKFNNGQPLSLDDIYVNCVGGDGSLSLSEIKNSNDPMCDAYKDTINLFIKSHNKYVNRDHAD